jgi:hypothetical protein
MNPLEEFLMVKAAADFPGMVGMMGKTMGKSLAQGVGAGAGAAGLAAVGIGIHGVYNAITAKRDFRNMLEWNQDLHDKDPRLLNQSFRTLRRFAPDMSKDPLVAGSMLRNMVEAPGGVAGMMHEAISGQKNIPQPIMEGWMKGTQQGVGEGMKRLDLEKPERDMKELRSRQGRREVLGGKEQELMQAQEELARMGSPARPPFEQELAGALHGMGGPSLGNAPSPEPSFVRRSDPATRHQGPGGGVYAEEGFHHPFGAQMPPSAPSGGQQAESGLERFKKRGKNKRNK